MSVPLNKIVDVTVELSNPAVISSDFNLGLIIGNSKVLTADNRVKVYSNETYQKQMVTDGFTTTSPEYLAASLYFSQNPTPANVAIGVMLEGETPVQAASACMLANENTYGMAFASTLTAEQIQAVAASVEALANPTVFFYQTNDPNCLQTGKENIMATLQGLEYNKSVGLYSSVDYASCALLGLFSGLNSMEANSAYTMAYKNLVGITPEDIGAVALSAIESYNGNVYCQFGRRYNFVYPGLAASGLHIDEVFLTDAIYFLIQENTVAGLISRRKIAQTESGMSEIISFITTACEQLVNIGFVAPGIWTGQPILELNTGDAIPAGYRIQAGSLAAQSAADRQKRITPPIYVAIKAAGAIEHVMVRVYVNR